jgi:cytoskeleton protein RodZ
MSEEISVPDSVVSPKQEGQEPVLVETDSAVDVGQQLRQAREAHGISIAEAAMALKLSPYQVESLEANDWFQWPKAVTRGFVRNYARYLELDAKPFMMALDDVPMLQGPDLAIGAGSPVIMPREGGGDRRDYARVVAGLIALVLALLVYFFVPAETWRSTLDSIKLFVSEKKADPEIIEVSTGVSDKPFEAVRDTPVVPVAPAIIAKPVTPVTVTPVASAVVTPVAPAPVDVTPVADKAPIATMSVPDTAPAPVAPPPNAAPTLTLTSALTPAPDIVLASLTASVPASVPTPTPTSPASAELSSSSSEALIFSFAQASWVEVRDRSGQVVFTQLNSADTQREVVGQPPFSVVIGNASHVTLQYKGKSVDLSRRSKEGVARLTIE